MVSANEIRGVIFNYIENGDADAFVIGFSKLSLGIHLYGDSEAIELAKLVESKLAEVYAGHISQVVFRDWLRANAFKSPALSAAASGNLAIEWFDSPVSEKMGDNSAAGIRNFNLLTETAA